jgi:hypothetical protein
MGTMTTPYQIVPTHIFRETESVSFYDCTIGNTNGCDVVRHGPYAISPPDDVSQWTFYVHYEQVDNNLCVQGTRVFFLISKTHKDPYHIVTLSPKVGSLHIPKGVYHRSFSLAEGSVLINQSERTEDFDVTKEFVPVSTRDDEELYRIVRNVRPIMNDLAGITGTCSYVTPEQLARHDCFPG